MKTQLFSQGDRHPGLSVGVAEFTSNQVFNLRPAGIPVLLAVLFALLSTGCCNRPDTLTTGGDYTLPITPADISYADLSQRYNEAAAPFENLWARTDVEIAWYEVDSDGDRNYRSETGDGKFIFRRPTDTALTVEKLGKTYIWAGSSSQRYWLFDLVDSDLKTLYIGSFAQLGSPGSSPFPLPVRPDRVPDLLGLMPLPAAELFGPQPPPVDLYDGQYLVDLPGMRLLIDPQTHRPTRVDLTDPAGYSVLTAKLLGRYAVEVESLPEAQWPILCERAEIYVSGYESRLTVEMNFADLDPGRVREQMFDLDALNKALKPRLFRSLDPATPE